MTDRSQPGGGALEHAAGRDPGRKAALAVAATAAAVLLAYGPTVAAMAEIWARSATFAHGFIVLPVSAWLLWRCRARLAAAVPAVTWAALPLLAALVLTWVAAGVVGVGVVAQFAAILMVPAAVLLLLGPAVVQAAAFPLGFALLAVPFGEFLMPPLMDVTATGSVLLLQLSGVPVFRDGWLISIPEGNFEVAEACSGVRYLIAAVATAALFGYFFFASTRKRLIFIGFTIVLTVLANVLRAYIIILLARLTDMRLAVGVDHFIYGWVLFSGLLAVLFVAGLRFADAPARAAGSPAPAWGSPAAASLAPAALAAALLLLAGPALLAWVGAGEGAAAPRALRVPPSLAGTPLAGEVARPAWLRPGPGLDATHLAYSGPGQAFGLHLFRAGPAGAATGPLRPYLAEKGVTVVGDEAARTAEGRAYRQSRIEVRGQGGVLIAYWFAVGGRQTANPVMAKAMELLTLLQGEHTRPALLAVALETKKLDQPAKALQDIVAQAMASPCLAARGGPAREPAQNCRSIAARGGQQGQREINR